MAAMQEGILVLDSGFVVRDSNAAARKMLAGGGQTMGLRLSEIIPLPERLKDFSVTDIGSNNRLEFEHDGRVLLASIVRLPGGDEFAAWLVTIVDFTAFRKLERDLAAQEKLAAMGRMSAMLAHEIRNPLQTFAHAVELMPRDVSKKQDELLFIMLEEVHRLNRLVTDVLNYSQPLRPQPVETNAMALITSSIQSLNSGKPRDIQYHCDEGSIIVDADHFRLVLDNLLRNAVEAGHPENRVEIRFSFNSDGWVLEIEDTGGGVPDEVKEHLFEPFVTGKPDGMGLGLATVWQTCQANQWNISLHDVDCGEDGHGTRFVVTGPVRPAFN
jgi:signal transduction histidine kinase